jgi:hypothetical protein
LRAERIRTKIRSQTGLRVRVRWTKERPCDYHLHIHLIGDLTVRWAFAMRNPARHLDVPSCNTLVGLSQLAADVLHIAHTFRRGVYHAALENNNSRYLGTALRPRLGMVVAEIHHLRCRRKP